MMKKVSIATLLLCLLSGITSCSVENDLRTGKSKGIVGDSITITASREYSGTRAVLNSGNDKETFWEAADKLTIWVGDGSTFTNSNKSDNFKLVSGKGRKAACFRGNPVYTAKPTDESILTAVLDRDDDFVDCSDGTTATVDFSTQQYGTLESVLKYDAFYATSTWNERDFVFRHNMSFVRWYIKINGISYSTTCDITLSATGMQNKAELDLAEGKLTGTNEGDITLKNVRIDANGNAVIYVALFPGKVTSKISAVVTMADGKVTGGQLGTFDSFTFKANKIYTASWTLGKPEDYVFKATSCKPIPYNFPCTVYIDNNDYYSTNHYWNNYFTVSSYIVTKKSRFGDEIAPVDWTITKYEYSDDDGENWIDNGTEVPSWIGELSWEDDYMYAFNCQKNGKATVKDLDFVNANPVSRLLKKATEKSNYDLSQGGETANCYVISAPGTYKIPLIIGNARKADGTVNDVCFNNPKPYVTYKGNAITSMWLKEHGGTPTSGSLVWSDCGDNIVSNLSISGDFLTFTVSADNIVQGNAVVAVKDADGIIMWSWHLWFTERDALSTIAFTNESNETNYFTRDELGLVIQNYKGTSYTVPRRVRVTVTQAGSNKTAQFQIIQNPYNKQDFNYRITLYQFGRKDAFAGVNNYKPGHPTLVRGKTTYQSSIQNPGTFYWERKPLPNDGGTDWCSTNYCNGWAVGNTRTDKDVPTSAIVKSVYDPCPAGFKMPGSNALNRITGYSVYRSTYNESTRRRYYHDGRGNWLPIVKAGYMSGRSGFFDVDVSDLVSWTAIPFNSDFAWNCFMQHNNSASTGKISTSWRACGVSVRPVKDR